VAERVEHERRAHELLERMKLEPGRYKFVRLAVNDLGQGGCGVWEVRPRLGLIGMLAGWWQVKLSSGCPLPKGPRSTRGPAARTRRYTLPRPRSLDPRRAGSHQHPTRHLSPSRSQSCPSSTPGRQVQVGFPKPFFGVLWAFCGPKSRRVPGERGHCRSSGRIRLNAFHLASSFLSGCGLSHQEPRSRRFLRMVRRR
jgi:hypothetical protein